MRERETIRTKKEELHLPAPWTSDSIPGAYRFCNVRREDDRVTRWVQDHVRAPFVDHPLLWLMICICRQINWPATLKELIETEGAWPSHVSFTPRRVGEVLNARQKRGEKIYTGAYIIPAPGTRLGQTSPHRRGRPRRSVSTSSRVWSKRGLVRSNTAGNPRTDPPVQRLGSVLGLPGRRRHALLGAPACSSARRLDLGRRWPRHASWAQPVTQPRRGRATDPGARPARDARDLRDRRARPAYRWTSAMSQTCSEGCRWMC